jgi:SAM-dependent methyltransferase
MSYAPRIYWPERARKQGARYVGHAADLDPESSATILAQRIDLLAPKCDAVLDFGCGVGRLAPVLAAKARRYVGVDIVEDAMALAPSLPNAKYLYLRDDRLPFRSASFDCVVAITVLQHIVADADFALWTAELQRVLRPAGHVLIVDHAPMIAPAPHMNPRGYEAVGEALGAEWCSVEVADGHWYGLGRRK